MKNIVLIIDDNQATVDVLASLFRQKDWLVQYAFSGSEGLDLAEHTKPDVIVSDLAMPGMSGFEVAEHMMITYSTACPILVALTGWTDRAIAEHAIQAGFDLVLTKPVDFERLFSMIELTGIAKRVTDSTHEVESADK